MSTLEQVRATVAAGALGALRRVEPYDEEQIREVILGAFELGMILTIRHPEYVQALSSEFETVTHRFATGLADGIVKAIPVERVLEEGSCETTT